MVEFYDFVSKYSQRLNSLNRMFNKKELVIYLDKLKENNKTDYDVIYFKDGNGIEFPGVFIFGFDFFIYELKEHDFKKYLGQNYLNFQIHRAYKNLLKKQKKIKISDILNEILKNSKDSYDKNKILQRILSLSYYFNWDLKKDVSDIELDYYIKIPEIFLLRLKQRFNLDIVSVVYEDKNLFMFLNAKGKIISVFKEKIDFSKKDINDLLKPTLKNVFKCKRIVLE
jgi:hypothetical protein